MRRSQIPSLAASTGHCKCSSACEKKNNYFGHHSKYMQPSQLVSKLGSDLPEVEPQKSSSPIQSLSLQEILNRFSQRALLETEIVALYQNAATTIKEALQVPFCRIWQVTSDGYSLRQIAGDVDPDVSQTVLLPTSAIVESAQHSILSL